MAYQADIVIAVKGATQLTNLQQQLQSTSAVIDKINNDVAKRGLATRSLQNLQTTVTQTNQAMRSAAAGTAAQKQAIDIYVKSLDAAQKAEIQLANAIKTRQKELGIAQATQRSTGGGGAGFGKRVGGAISGSIIGGAFPLLFGQGGGAATGGAVGGLVGGLAGPGGSFAGSLLGTLLGDIASKGQAIKQLSQDIGFSAQQTNVLSQAFKQAGSDFDKFAASVQNIRGLGLSLNDQADVIKLVSTLTETYGGKIDKVTDAFTGALEQGKVTQATLNQLTSQGIPIQDALAEKYNVSRDAILKMAKDGTISVQTLADVLVDMGNKGLEAGEKPKSAFDQFTAALGNTSSAIGTVASTLLTSLAPAIDTIILKATEALNILTETINTELLRSQIQAKSGKILGPKKLQQIETEAAGMAARRYPSKAQGRQLAAGPGIISPRAQAEFQIIKEQLIRNELQQYGYDTGILKAPKPAVNTSIGRISAVSQAAPSPGPKGRKKPSGEGEAKRLATLLLNQQAITSELKNQYVYSEKIFAAEMAKDPQLVRRLQGEQQLKEWGIETVKLLEKEKTTVGQLAIAKAQQAKQAVIRQKTEQDLAKLEKERSDRITRTVEDLQTEVKIKQAATQAERDRLRIAYEMKVLQQDDPTIAADQLAAIKQAKEQLAMPTLGTNLIRQQIGTLTDELTKLTDVGTQVAAIAENIGTSFANSFKGVISGAMTAQEALASFFQNVADRFLDMAAQIIAKWIEMTILNSILNLFPGGSAASTSSGPVGGRLDLFNLGAAQYRASGGPVSAGSPYIVGERGPELFVPGRSGGIVPNNALGGGGDTVVNGGINITVENTGERLGPEAQKQIARQVQSIVMGTLMNERRSGGVLA